MNVALDAHPLVRWLLDTEIDVKRRVAAFASDQASDTIEVAGPPTDADLAQYAKNESRRVGLPCIRLMLRMVKHHLTGEPGIRVDCSDDHIQELARWRWRAYRTQHKGAA